MSIYRTCIENDIAICITDIFLWTLIQCNKNRLQTAEMKYLRRTAGYTLLNHKRNEEILEELHVTPLEDKLCTYRHKWFQHVHRLEDNRPPKQLLNYHPKGRRRPGWPLKRLLDDMTAETETSHPGLNSWWIWCWWTLINIILYELYLQHALFSVQAPPNTKQNTGNTKHFLSCLLGWSAVQSRWSWSTFQRCILILSSGWRQYAPLKRRSTSTWLYGATSQKTLNFVLAAVRTWNLTKHSCFSAMFLSPGKLRTVKIIR
jgi:hypothetical protein